MAFCTQCGVVMHEMDARTHECKPEDKPEIGKPRRLAWTIQQSDTV